MGDMRNKTGPRSSGGNILRRVLTPSLYSTKAGTGAGDGAGSGLGAGAGVREAAGVSDRTGNGVACS